MDEQYIVIKPLKDKTMSGYVNIPLGVICDVKENIIYCDNKPICNTSSDQATVHFKSYKK